MNFTPINNIANSSNIAQTKFELKELASTSRPKNIGEAQEFLRKFCKIKINWCGNEDYLIVNYAKNDNTGEMRKLYLSRYLPSEFHCLVNQRLMKDRNDTILELAQEVFDFVEKENFEESF